MPYKTKVRKIDMTNPDAIKGLGADTNSARSLGASFYDVLEKTGVPQERRGEILFLAYEKVTLPYLQETNPSGISRERKGFRYVADGFQRAARKAGDTQTAEYVSRKLAELGQPVASKQGK